MTDRIRILTGAGIASCLLLVAAPAQAGEQVKSKLRIGELTANGAEGKLNAKESRCERRRKVTLFLEGEYVPSKAGKDRTDRKGRWEVQENLEPGKYFAKAAKKTVQIDGERTTCKPAESKTVRLR